MHKVRRWWRLLSAVAVLAVLATAVLAGTTRTAVESASSSVARGAAVVVPAEPEPPAYAAPQPGALVAPVQVRAAVASRGAAFAVADGAALGAADVPSRALVAYQRAASVIDAADPRCHLEWELLAALGKVASDHGRSTGSSMDDDAVLRPRALGPRLTGRSGATQRVVDTDAGVLDGDPWVDRALGAMMLLPSTWSVVNVDADGDGRRSAQDLDDAALGAAVFLCAGPGDLEKGRLVRRAVERYHPGAGWVRAVLGVRAAYAAAPAVSTVSVLARGAGVDHVVVPPPVPVVAEPTPDPTYDAGQAFADSSPSAAPSPVAAPTPTAVPDQGPSSQPTPSASATPSAEPTRSQEPSEEPTCEPSPTEPTTGPSPTAEPEPDGCPSPTETPAPTPTETPAPTDPPTTGGTDPAVGVALAVPGAALLWWRRRRRVATAR